MDKQTFVRRFERIFAHECHPDHLKFHCRLCGALWRFPYEECCVDECATVLVRHVKRHHREEMEVDK
jgi:hypothetical protein